MPTTLLWSHRDLRPADHPALLAARDAAGGVPAGCPLPIVDHGEERQVTLDRYRRVRGA